MIIYVAFFGEDHPGADSQKDFCRERKSNCLFDLRKAVIISSMKAVLFAVLLLSGFYSVCGQPVEGSVRLVNGTNYNSQVGRVEVYSSGAWYSVCAGPDLCTNAAKVVCRQLGYSDVGAQVYGLALYGQGNGTVGFENVSCLGTEPNVTFCNTSSPSTCSHSMDAAVSCVQESICLLVGGHTGCCVSGCYISFPHYCWCDVFCHIYQDCCPGIDATCPGSGGVVPGGLPLSTSCSNVGDITFVNGVDSAGRIMVCDTDNKWKTVCDQGFDENEARVACRSLGLSVANFTIYNVTKYGQGTEDIFAKDLQCAGDEDYLTDCAGSDSCCGHHRDVGLYCQPACTEGQIRFMDGPTEMEGRVEICHSGRWGTVCDDFWQTKDARVACKMAGFPWRGAQAFQGSYTSDNYRLGVGPIWLDNVQCDGTEGSLWNCTSNNVGVHNCGHSEDASVKCAAGPCELANYIDSCCDPNTDGNCQGVNSEDVCHCSLDCQDHNDCCIDIDLICRCNDYDVRLRDGTVANEGRVEFCYNGEWGTVCDDFWNSPDATVVCRQLGYSDQGAQSFSFSYFGQGTGPIWLDNVFCSGNEQFLVNCSANAIGSHNCAHYEDAGVRCTIVGAPECYHGQARLVRGDSEYEGQLEVCYNGQWGTVCDDYFGQVDANVACRTIFPTLPSGGAIYIQYSYIYFGYGSGPINMDNVQCSGNEAHLFNCSFITNHNCYHYEDVGLACYQPGSYEGQPQLLPGPSAGRLMVYADNSWGTVCRNSFDVNDARVVCKELGQPTGSPRVYKNLQYGRGFGSVKYSNVGCTGNETQLNDCYKLSSGFYCSHYSDVGVGCEEACTDGQLKLVGGENVTEGRVEICRDGSWGAICDDTNTWGAEEARVVCKQLGFPYTAAQVQYFGPGADPVHYSNFACKGSEVSLMGCSGDMTPTCTSHTQDVGVTCLESCTPGEVRLVDGGSSTQGRLEVCLGGLWGTVCDDQFENVDAQVVCKQLGLPYAGAEAKHNAEFGQGDDHIALTNLYCTGSETQLLSCIFNTGSAVTCTHANDAGVVCQDLCTNGAIRVDGGDTPNMGRVEVCYNGEWGTICDKGWNTPDVEVACYQLGFESNSSTVRAFGGSKFGPGLGPIYFRDMGCTGTENSLTYCTSNTDIDLCDHSDDAGLRCDGNIIVPTATPTGSPGSQPPPGLVTNVTLTIFNTTYARLTWDAPDVTNGIITSYMISINNNFIPAINLLGNQPRVIYFTTLKPGVPYTYNITASNIFGTGEVYSQQFFTAELTPNTPVTVWARRVDEYTIYINWKKLTMSEARGVVTSYTVRWAEYDGTFTQIPKSVTVSADASSFTTTAPLVPSMQYSVTVFASNIKGAGPPTSPPVIVNTTSTAIFQLKLGLLSGQECGTWTSDSSEAKISDIINTIVFQVNTRCGGCKYKTDHIAKARFQCNPNEVDQVTFRAQLFAPGNSTNAATILGYIQDWLNSQRPTISIVGVDFTVDPSCNVKGATSFDEEFCETQRVTTSSISRSNAAAISSSISTGIAGTAGTGRSSASVGIGLGVAIGAIVVFGVMIIVLVFIVVFVRRTKIKYQAGDANKDIVGYSNRMAFPEGNEDNISQHIGSTVHDDDFQEALNMISEDIDDKAKLVMADEGQVYINMR